MIVLDGEGLSLESLAAVARHDEKVEIARSAKERMAESRAVVEDVIASGKRVYGVNTGFGPMADVVVPADKLEELQLNLIRSHAAGVGEPLTREQVRASMVARANALAKGYSGVRPLLVETLASMLNERVHPVVPSRGSVGASGDLAQLAHLTLPMIGEGEAEHRGEKMSGADALADAGLTPLVLQAKEGIAMTNGTAFMCGVGGLVAWDMLRIMRDAVIAAAISFEALQGSDLPYDDRLSEARPLAGQRAVARSMRTLLEGSRIVPSHPGEHKVQDPYTLRCVPQVLGPCLDTGREVRRTLEVELNSATDNPLVFSESGDIVSGGNFHGQPVAMALDNLGLAMTVVAGYAERRIARLLDGSLSGLPPFLTQEGGLKSGLMMAQYTAAALASENKVLAHPASADSIPTSANQEDYVNMGLTSALKADRILANVRSVVAIEYLAAAQAMEFVDLEPGLGVGAAVESVRTAVKPLDADRPIHGDIARLETMVHEGTVSRAVEKEVGELLGSYMA